MDLVALSIFLLAFIICSLLVFLISVYGTKEVSFEENLKASHGVKKGKNQGQDAKKKVKKSVKGPENVGESVSFLKYFYCQINGDGLINVISNCYVNFSSDDHLTTKDILIKSL